MHRAIYRVVVFEFKLQTTIKIISNTELVLGNQDSTVTLCTATKFYNDDMKFDNNLEKSALLMTYISKFGLQF